MISCPASPAPTTSTSRPLDHRSREQTGAGDEREQEERVDERDATREPETFDRIEEVDGGDRDHGRDPDPEQRPPHVPRRHVAPPPLVEAEPDEDDELDREHDPERLHQHALVVRRDLEVEPQLNARYHAAAIITASAASCQSR